MDIQLARALTSLEYPLLASANKRYKAVQVVDEVFYSLNAGWCTRGGLCAEYVVNRVTDTPSEKGIYVSTTLEQARENAMSELDNAQRDSKNWAVLMVYGLGKKLDGALSDAYELYSAVYVKDVLECCMDADAPKEQEVTQECSCALRQGSKSVCVQLCHEGASIAEVGPAGVCLLNFTYRIETPTDVKESGWNYSGGYRVFKIA